MPVAQKELHPIPLARRTHMSNVILRAASMAAFDAGVAGLIGCQRGKGPPPAPPPPAVTVTKPIMAPVQSYYEYNGYLEAIESVQVKARVKGFLDEIAFAEGEEVKAGDLL